MAEKQPAVDMGNVYNHFADEFAKSDALPTWRYVGMPALERMLAPFWASDATFLDLGAASGRVEKGLLLPNGVRPENITGVEISPAQAEIARKRIPGATFIVGDITTVSLPQNSFDVAFSHMVFEHLDDEQLLKACTNAFGALRPGGTFAVVVTHPDKMTDLEGNLVTSYGHFKTTAPWGGELDNWRRSVQQTVSIIKQAGFAIERTEELPYPQLSEAVRDEDRQPFMEGYEKYKKYPAMRLAILAKKSA